LSQFSSSPNPPGSGDALEKNVTTAIERKPSVRVPADFVARVAARAASLPAPATNSAPSFSRLIALACAAVLLVAIFVLAANAKASFTSLAFDSELLLLFQLVGIAGWFTLLPGRHDA